MTNDNSSHPPWDALTAFGLGRLSGTARSRVEHHIAACPTCGDRLEAVADDTFIIRLRAAVAQEARGQETLAGEQGNRSTWLPEAEVPPEPAGAEGERLRDPHGPKFVRDGLALFTQVCRRRLG